MKKAIEFLRSMGIVVQDNGNIISGLPQDEDGLVIIDRLEELTDNGEFCYTIQHNKVKRSYF